MADRDPRSPDPTTGSPTLGTPALLHVVRGPRRAAPCDRPRTRMTGSTTTARGRAAWGRTSRRSLPERRLPIAAGAVSSSSSSSRGSMLSGGGSTPTRRRRRRSRDDPGTPTTTRRQPRPSPRRRRHSSRETQEPRSSACNARSQARVHRRDGRRRLRHRHQDAVEQFQTASNLTADGIFGPQRAPQ